MSKKNITFNSSRETRQRFRPLVVILASLGFLFSLAIHIAVISGRDMSILNDKQLLVFAAAAILILSLPFLAAVSDEDDEDRLYGRRAWEFRIRKLPIAFKVLSIAIICYAGVYLTFPTLIIPLSVEQIAEVSRLEDYPSIQQETLNKVTGEQSRTLQAVSSYWMLLFLLPIILLKSPLKKKSPDHTPHHE